MRKGRLSRNCAGINACTLALFAVLLSALAAFGQTPPPNDNYSNRITLTGTDITFSGSLAGATIEDTQETGTFEYYYVNPGLPARSVWWTWTAPTNTVLTLQILNPSATVNVANYLDNALVVYDATNGSSSPSGLVLPARGTLLDTPPLAPQTLSIPVSSGSNYQIQLIGYATADFTIRLVATNTPVIITQPRSQTVYSNASALFYVVAAGVSQTNFTFQWSLNGTNLSGETAPMLALTHIDSTMAGAYTVAVSNSAGVTVSAPAMLTVSQSNFPVSLAAIGAVSNAFALSVAGELGRSYRLQSSANLSNWAFEAEFPMGPYTSNNVTSIFFETNSRQVLSATNISSAAYYRVSPYVIGAPDAEICINNLRQIRIAKLLWQRDYNNTSQPNFYFAAPTATPSLGNLLPYFPHGTAPYCPDDLDQMFQVSYVINNLKTEPVCQIHPGHILEDPQ